LAESKRKILMSVRVTQALSCVTLCLYTEVIMDYLNRKAESD